MDFRFQLQIAGNHKRPFDRRFCVFQPAPSPTTLLTVLSYENVLSENQVKFVLEVVLVVNIGFISAYSSGHNLPFDEGTKFVRLVKWKRVGVLREVRWCSWGVLKFLGVGCENHLVGKLCTRAQCSDYHSAGTLPTQPFAMSLSVSTTSQTSSYRIAAHHGLSCTKTHIHTNSHRF